MTRRIAKTKAGFTLIEALVALAILAVASAALITAAQSHVRRVGQVEDRAYAQWIAQNRLAELHLGAEPDDAASAILSGRRYEVETTLSATDSDAIMRVRVQVRRADADGVLATLDGFVPAERTP